MANSHCNCDYCLSAGNRKDFQHTKGGPEVAPHRKKKGKTKPFSRVDHKHIYDTNGWYKQFRSRWDRERGGYYVDFDRWYWIRDYVCIECDKHQKYEYSWTLDKPAT
jgi:hypothetical protein